LLALGIIGAPILDEGVLAFAGYLVYEGKMQLLPILAAAFLGSACGITLSHGLGRTVGIYLLAKFGHAVRITRDKVSHVHTWYDRCGKVGSPVRLLLAGRTTLDRIRCRNCETTGIGFRSVCIYRSLHISVTFVTAGYFLGRQWTMIFGKIRPTLMTTSIIIVSLFLLYIAGQEFLRQRK